MDFSAGNIIVITAIIIALAVMVWQIMSSKSPNQASDDEAWHDDMEATEDSLDESEEFLRRMERLSKRSRDENDKKT